MNILFFTIGTEVTASSRTRVYQFIPHLEREGLKHKIITYLSERRCKDNINMNRLSIFRKVYDKIFSWLQILKVLFHASSYDVVFIQRVLLPVIIQKILKRINKNIIFEFDDALQLSGKKFFSRLINILRNSRVVIVENDFNKKFVLKYNNNVKILTGPIDIDRYRPRENHSINSTITIGWIGSPSSLFNLLDLAPVFATLQVRYPTLVIRVIGADNFSIPGVIIDSQKWSLETEVNYLQSFTIGIMSLRDDDWSKGKGGYKLLQYMAVGIPCVASPVSINKEIIDEGVNGFLAATPQDWIKKLTILIEDEKLRNKMGAKGRKKAEDIYSYQANISKLVDAIASPKNKFRV